MANKPLRRGQEAPLKAQHIIGTAGYAEAIFKSSAFNVSDC